MPARKDYFFFIGLNLFLYLKSFLGQKNTFFLLADRSVKKQMATGVQL